MVRRDYADAVGRTWPRRCEPSHDGRVDTVSAEGLNQLVREVLTHHMLEVTVEPTFVLDGDGRVVIANRAVARLGWDPGALVGRAWAELVGDDGAPERVLSSHIAVSAPGIAVTRPGRIRRGDGIGHQAVLVITYRLWLGESDAPSVVVLRPLAAGVGSGCAAAG